jgi:hypothetical protein
MSGEMVWHGSKYHNPAEYALYLSDEDVKEIENAIAEFKGDKAPEKRSLFND